MAELGERWGCFSLSEPKKNIAERVPPGVGGCLGGCSGLRSFGVGVTRTHSDLRRECPGGCRPHRPSDEGQLLIPPLLDTPYHHGEYVYHEPRTRLLHIRPTHGDERQH